MKTTALGEVEGRAPATDRVEARVNSELKRLFQRAADLQGLTLSDFLISSLRQAALRTLKEHGLIRLSDRDAALFVRTLLKPPAPNAALRQAARRYRRLMRHG
jgi:uncharacterized protein (DUF1778 family)